MKKTTPMQRYRARLRTEGLRPVQLWVPDTRSAAFVKEFRRQAREVAGHETMRNSERRAIDALLDDQDVAGWK